MKKEAEMFFHCRVFWNISTAASKIEKFYSFIYPIIYLPSVTADQSHNGSPETLKCKVQIHCGVTYIFPYLFTARGKLSIANLPTSMLLGDGKKL